MSNIPVVLPSAFLNAQKPWGRSHYSGARVVSLQVLGAHTRVGCTILGVKSDSWKDLALFQALRVFLRSILYYSSPRLIFHMYNPRSHFILEPRGHFQFSLVKESVHKGIVHRYTCTVSSLWGTDKVPWATCHTILRSLILIEV